MEFLDRQSCEAVRGSFNLNNGERVKNLMLSAKTSADAKVQLLPVSMALLSQVFHISATSFAKGSSGLGALSNAWIESSTVRICRAGDHLSGGMGRD